ncbi:MAG TPA: GAF domain-containing sensor histidine kinase, partial [Candidatus Binatia bacterium]
GPRPGGRSERVLSGKPSTIVENNPSLESQDHRTKTLAKAFTTFAWVAIATKERALGIINVGTRGDRTLSRSQISLLESIGASLGVALENATLYRESQRKEEIQRIVKELSQDITLLDIDTLLAKLTAQVIQLLKVDLADIRMLAGESWQVKCLSGIDPRAIPPADFIPEGRSEWIVKNRRALMIPDITRHTEIPGGKTLKRIGIRGYLGVPLFSRKGEVMGVLRALTYQSRGFAQDEIELLQQFANGAAVAIENTLLFEQVQAGHEQMQRLSRRLVEAQETERRAIARELHDEIGQILTGLKLMLQTGDGLSAKQFQKRLHKAQGLINELFTRVRALSVDLRPAMLDDLGLLPTLTWHFERFTAQTGVAVRFKHSGIQDKRFSPDLETAAYRIIQEALTNVARHANAAEAAVEVLATPQALTLEVRDRGCGFDFKAASRSGKGSGLGGMSERAMSLGGGLAIESRTERGTRLMATLPIGNIGNDPSAKGQRL